MEINEGAAAPSVFVDTVFADTVFVGNVLFQSSMAVIDSPSVK